MPGAQKPSEQWHGRSLTCTRVLVLGCLRNARPSEQEATEEKPYLCGLGLGSCGKVEQKSSDSGLGDFAEMPRPGFRKTCYDVKSGTGPCSQSR